MELALAFIGIPVATYLILACLPHGRPALIGCLVAMALAALFWISQMGSDESYLVALIALVISAIALERLVQILRLVIRLGRLQWAYQVIVVPAAGIPTLNVLGF